MEVVENPFKNDEENGNFSSKRVCSFTSSGDNRHRIIRVSRASGGKDRHSKVLTSKGLRDRRVRLSVSTAIQFYDLQDRLGFEQPSKAVEWLIEAASEAIAGLPSLNSSFPLNPIEISDDLKKGIDGIDQRRNLSLVERSNCSSNSETSKGSLGFSLSRSEILVNRAKARDRARERTAKEKEREQESCNVLTISDNPSFTELLSVGINGGGVNNNAMAMDYLASSGHNQALPMSSSSTSPFNSNQDRFQHFSLVPENMNDYNLNFTISGNFNRGTLQSNISPSSLLPYLQRFPHLDGSNVPFFIGAAPPTAPLQSDNHHHHQLTPALFDGGWQLCYAADGTHHSDQKGKGKN